MSKSKKNNKKINIAIDGHSSCGKSTVAKQLAKYFSYIYIDTGAMYRAVCLYCLENHIIDDGKIYHDLLNNHLKNINIEFNYNAKKNICETFLNGINVENKIRGLLVSENVSKISKIKEVRNKLILIQKKSGINKGVVMDGRDIGTIVFPDAEIKFFITASLEERAKRRAKELKNISFEQIINNIKKRDFHDTNREENPLKIADGAIIIDNTFLSINQQFEIILSHCKNVFT